MDRSMVSQHASWSTNVSNVLIDVVRASRIGASLVQGIFWSTGSTPAKWSRGRSSCIRPFELTLDIKTTPFNEVDKLRTLVCAHAASSIGAVVLCAWMHSAAEVKAPWAVGESAQRRCQQLMKCRECDTDFRVHIKKEYARIRLVLHMYENLGGRAPLKPEPLRQFGELWLQGGPLGWLVQKWKEKVEAMLARNLEQSFWTGSWISSPLPVTNEVGGRYSYLNVVQTWNCTESDVYTAHANLPCFGNPRRDWHIPGLQDVVASIRGQIDSLRRSMAKMRAALRILVPTRGASPTITLPELAMMLFEPVPSPAAHIVDATDSASTSSTPTSALSSTQD